MRTAWFAAGLMALILTFIFALNRSVSTSVDEILIRLDTVEHLAETGEFEAAQQALLLAHSLWEEKMPLFSMSIPARHTSEVSAALHGLHEQLMCKNYNAYKSDSALLLAALKDMQKGVLVSWENVM